MTNKKLAEKIAEALFTDGQGRKADRLELKHGARGLEKSGAGWGFKPMIDQIEKILDKKGTKHEPIQIR